jgi:hypothetical protein
MSADLNTRLAERARIGQSGRVGSRDDSDGEPLETLDVAPDDGGPRSEPRPARSWLSRRVWIVTALVAVSAVAVLVSVVVREHPKRVAHSPVSRPAVAYPASFRYFGTVHTRFGDASMVCGEEAMPACGAGTHLEFVRCPATLSAYFRGYYYPAFKSDQRIRALIGRRPPSGQLWSWGCGRDLRPTPGSA